jgi:hypothetical protein
LKELESWLKRGQNVPFLREICPRKKCTPNIGAITGILLLKETNSTGDDTVAICLGSNPMVEKVEYKRNDE